MNVRHMTNAHLLISVYSSSGPTLISTAGMFLDHSFPFCEQLSNFFAKLVLFKLMLFLRLRWRINILLCVKDVTKIFTTCTFAHVLNQNLCTLFARKGEGDGPGKVAIS